MDNNENNQNNEQPQDLNVSMQKSSTLLKKVMNKTNKTIKSATSMAGKLGKNRVGMGAKLKALKKKVEGSKKIAAGNAKSAAGATAVGAGAVTSGIGLGLKAAAVAANLIPGAGQAISAALNTAATPVVKAGNQAMKTGADLAKSGEKLVASGTKDMHAAEQIEKGGKDPGGDGWDGGDSGIPGIPKPKIPDKLKIIKDALLKFAKTKIFKVGIVIFVALIILIIIVIFSRRSRINNGTYIPYDESNVPYVVKSQVMSSLTIISDGSGGFMYGFTDSEGNVIDLDTELDNALQMLKDNNSTALSDMGSTDEERKELLKKLIQAEVATQYPDLSISSFSSGEQESASSSDSSSSTNTNVTVNDLTLDEKIYQMILLGVTVSDGSTYSNSQVGGFFLFGGSNYDSLNSMGSSSKVAPFVATDDEGGAITRAAADTPSAKSYGDSKDYSQLESDEVSKTNLLLSKGINLNLSPVSDVTSSGTMYTSERSYSSDPEVVKECIKTVLKARSTVSVNGVTLSSTLKHYPGYPNDTTNSDNGVVYDNRSVEEINRAISVFKSGISSGVQSVMTSNVIYNNLDSSNPASLSSTIISGLRSNYSGIIMTDDLDASATSGISDRYKKAVIAGNDIILLDEGNLDIAFNQIKAAVQSGEISEKRINESVERILNWKKQSGVIKGNTGNIQRGGVVGDIQGNIKIQRKDESGSTKVLTYTDPTTFNNMISSNNSDVMNYYTLVDSSRSGSSGGSNGVVLAGSDVAEQIWNFFINDMGYSEYVAAGILGNIMRECGGDTLSGLDPSAQNSYGNGHYGIIQWDMVYCSEVVGQDLAGQLEFFSKWIQTNEFDNYARNYKSGFSYQEFLTMTDPEQIAIAFGAVMERFGTPYSTGGMSSEYEKRGNNAKNAYATLAGTTTSSSSSSSSGSSSSKRNTSLSSISSSSSGNQSFLQIAIDCHEYLRENGYKYSQGRSMPVVRGESDKRIDCTAYVSWCLYEYGLYNDSWQLTSSGMVDWGKSNLETIYEGHVTNISEISQIQPGDIIVQTEYGSPSSSQAGHAQIFYGFNSNGNAVWLNCGGKNSIEQMEGEGSQNDFSSQPILYVFRVPGSGAPVVTSLDNFLFIGDSRYSTTATQIDALGNNIKNKGVASAKIDEWLAVANNGGTGTVQSTIVDITGTYSGISVQLGANSVYNNVDVAVSQMKEFLEKLKKLHPGTPIFVNSCLNVNSNATSSGYTWDVITMRDCIKEFDRSISDFCNQNSDLYFVDISDGLVDDSGFVKLEYESDGLHCNSAGAGIFAQNIKNTILGSNATVSSSSSTLSSDGGYKLVVANKKDVTTNVVNNYSYSYTYGVEKNNGIRHTGFSQSTSTPSSKTVSSSTNNTYSSTTVDYQSALKDYTLYFDFLWAVLINSSGDTDFISSWADLAIDGNVTITVYNDVTTSTTSSSVELGTYEHTAYDASNSMAIYDVYNVTEVTTVATKTIDSKPAITNANTWLIKYVNDASTYSEFKGKSKEKITEKTNPNAVENNIVKLLQSNKGRLSQLTREEDTVDEMLEENEKVNFMIDIYSYILQAANGKTSDEITLKMDGLLNTSVFDLSASVSTSTRKVLFYTSIDLSELDKEMLYKAVEKICEPYGSNVDENTQRKKYVTCVILNRVMSSKFPNTVSDVLNQKYQFPNLSSGDINENATYTDETKIAVDNAIIAGDCSQYSVYFTTSSNADSLDWDNTYDFTFNDGNETDNSFNYYTIEEVVVELKKYETSVESGIAMASPVAKAIVAWAEAQVGNSSFYNKYNGQTMNSTNYCAAFVKSAYYEAGLEYIGGNAIDLPYTNPININADGSVDWSNIPVGAIIVSNGTPVNGVKYGHVCLYVGNGYVIEAGGSTIKKTPIDDSYGASGHNCAPFLGWGFAVSDQDIAYNNFVVTINKGNYPEGITEGTNFYGWGNRSGDGVMMIYTANSRSYKVYCQGSGSYSGVSYWGGNIQSKGCGITSTSIILNGYGVNATPETVKNDGLCPNGNDMNYYIKEFAKYGIESHYVESNLQEVAIENLKAGRPILIHVQKGIPVGSKGYSGHYMTLLGMNSSGQIFLGDPGSTTNSGYYDPSQIFTDGLVNMIVIDN